LNQPSAMEDISRKQIQYARQEDWPLAARRTIRNYRKTLL
jgi:hypothetical protein